MHRFVFNFASLAPLRFIARRLLRHCYATARNDSSFLYGVSSPAWEMLSGCLKLYPNAPILL
ncbi:MAG: hypothetical protein J6W29_03780 [Neisseriaceae bacterium]|nr:hypothetical protein [Neisseriaceae bacterium]